MVTCGACAAENNVGARFCSNCGTALAQTCPACGAAASGRFCSECGGPLSATARPPAPVTAPAEFPAPRDRSAPVAERRITSVLFADLVGFTTLSESRDAEEVRELLSRYFESARTVIERYGGVVEKFIGDAVMAVWGVPTAHEDDAERAVRAGIDLVDAVAELGESVELSTLALRVGIVTGEVAVTLGATGQGMVAGDAVNTAARVQAAAPAGSVWVDETTRAATAAAVAYDDVGEHELKGKVERVRLFAARTVIATSGGARRVDGLEAPFSGRDRDIRLLKELFHATLEERRPRLVAVFGPAGVGKSRLGWEFDKYIDGINDIVHWHHGRCLSYGEGVAFWALAEMVRGRLGILEGDGDEIVVGRLEEGLALHVSDVEERAWLSPRIATLIGVGDVIMPGTTFSRDDLFAAWRTFFERLAFSEDSVGTYLQIDDLQWADQGLLDFIDYVLDMAQAPIFILALARSDLTERVPAFGRGKRVTAIHLEPLPDAAMSRLVDGLVVGLPDAVRATLVERSEGIPLFAVETVRGLIDKDAVIPREGRYVLAPDAAERVDLDNLALPTTLHTLIASRLDALPPDERRVVQDASVIGQAFTRGGLDALVAAVGGDIDVDSALIALVRKEIFAVESDPRSPERGQYRFVQALVRGVAYDTLARRDRKVRHLAAADHLAGEADADTIPAVLASHYIDALAAASQDPDAQEIAARGVALLERAASLALDLGAPSEARKHLDTALGLVTDDHSVAGLTEKAARAAMAAGAINDAITLAERSRKTYETQEREVDAARALALWAEAHIIAGTGQPTIEPLTAAYGRIEGRLDAGPVVAQVALQIARAFYLSVGDAEAAIPWFDRAVVISEAMEDLPLLAATLASYAGAFVLVGRSRMGLGLLRVSLELARQLDQPKIQLRPLNNLASFLATRDVAAASTYAEEGLAIARRLGDSEWGLTIIASAVHVQWTMGRWDASLDLVHELATSVEQTSVYALIGGYVASIEAARGLPFVVPELGRVVSGTRSDVILDVSVLFLSAAEARASGDLQVASDRSDQALRGYVESSGVDDDFPLFWITAVEDALAIGDVVRARELLVFVSDAPPGHVPAYDRAQLPRLRAMVDVAAGRHDTVEADFTAATIALRDFGAPFYTARSLFDHARWLLDQGRSDEATPLLEEASQIFEDLQAAPWLEQVRQLRTVLVD